MDCESIQREIAATVRRTKEDCPFVPSITNSVTMELVANAQLAASPMLPLAPVMITVFSILHLQVIWAVFR